MCQHKHYPQDRDYISAKTSQRKKDYPFRPFQNAFSTFFSESLGPRSDIADHERTNKRKDSQYKAGTIAVIVQVPAYRKQYEGIRKTIQNRVKKCAELCFFSISSGHNSVKQIEEGARNNKYSAKSEVSQKNQGCENCDQESDNSQGIRVAGYFFCEIL